MKREGWILLLDNDQGLTCPWLLFPTAAFVGLVIRTEDRWAAQGDGAGWMIFRGHRVKACVVGMGVVQVRQCPREDYREVKVEESLSWKGTLVWVGLKYT